MNKKQNHSNSAMAQSCDCCQEKKKQNLLLQKILEFLKTSFIQFKKTWITFAALGVLISSIQLYRDFTKPNIIEEMKHFISIIKLDEQYQIHDSISSFNEVKELNKIQGDVEVLRRLCYDYPDRIDQLVQQEVSIDNFKDHIEEFKSYCLYRITLKNHFISILDSSIPYIAKHAKYDNGMVTNAFSLRVLSELQDVNEKTSDPSIIECFFAALIPVGCTSVEKKYVDDIELASSSYLINEIRRVSLLETKSLHTDSSFLCTAEDIGKKINSLVESGNNQDDLKRALKLYHKTYSKILNDPIYLKEYEGYLAFLSNLRKSINNRLIQITSEVAGGSYIEVQNLDRDELIKFMENPIQTEENVVELIDDVLVTPDSL